MWRNRGIGIGGLVALLALGALGQDPDIAALKAQAEAQAADLAAAIARLNALGVPEPAPYPGQHRDIEGNPAHAQYREANPAPQPESYLDPARLYLRRVGPDVIVAMDLLQGSPGEILRNTGKYIVQSPASFLTSAAVAYVTVRGIQGKLGDDWGSLRGKSRSKASGAGIETERGGTTVVVQGNGDVTVISGDGNTNSRDTTETTTTHAPPVAEPEVIYGEPL